MNQFTNFDMGLIGATLVMVIIACRHGLTRELLHTVLFSGAMVSGTIFMMQTNAPKDATEAAFLSVNLAYFALAAYLLTSVTLKLVAPIMMKTVSDIGLRNRLTSGGLAFMKILVTGVFLNVWYIAHAPEPHPQRLLALPHTLQDSLLLQLSDANWADRTAQFLASKGIMNAPMAEPEVEGGTLTRMEDAAATTDLPMPAQGE